MGNPVSGLAGQGFLQSPDEWAARNRVLADTLCGLAERHLRPNPRRGLDVGCQKGALADYLNARTMMSWEGIDVNIHHSLVRRPIWLTVGDCEDGGIFAGWPGVSPCLPRAGSG